MGRLNDLLNEWGEFFIATVDGNQPKLRPIGAHTEEDGMVRFYIGGHKDVFRQLTENPLCEIAGMVKKGQWVRITGKAVFDRESAYADRYLAEVSPGLKNIYNDKTGHRLVSFYLDNMTASLYAMGRIIEKVQ